MSKDKLIKIPFEINLPAELFSNVNIEFKEPFQLYPKSYFEDKPPVVEEPKPEPPVIEEPTPKPPVTPPSNNSPIELGKKLLNGKWSKPKEVWEFDEQSGGNFITVFEHNRFFHFQQDRKGGKIRIFTTTDGHSLGNKNNMFIVDRNNNNLDAQLEDVKIYGNSAYAVVHYDGDVYVAKGSIAEIVNGKNDKLYLRLDNKVEINGAKDTKHAIIKHNNKWFIYGRKRRQDWLMVTPNLSNEVLLDRRGVRILVSDSFDGNYTELNPLDPAIEQPNYVNNVMRHDYYSTRVGDVNGVLVYGISTFNKNQNRIPSTRPERITGTGTITPLLAVSSNGKDIDIISHKETPVDLKFHSRTTEWKEAQKFEPEVGQIYCYGIVYDGKTVKMYYNHRYDTHYLVKPSIKYPNCKVFMIEMEL